MNPKGTPSHYASLDGLRGVAAVIVLLYHIGEAHAVDRFTQMFNHGYLAVDFFFILSGFVVGYAYDRRTAGLGVGPFFKRRLIRLQPMVVLGTVIGAIFFYFGGGTLVADAPVGRVLLLTLLGALMLPVPASLDVRGWGETFPLNGPQWSLFFEYCANIFYVLIFRYLPKASLAVLTAAAAVLTTVFLLTNPNGDVIGGWQLTSYSFYAGFVRLLFPFTAGLLLARIKRPNWKIPCPFLISTVLLSIALLMPRIGGAGNLFANALYEAVCILFVFPLIIVIGSSADGIGRFARRPAAFLGRISYPLYLIHYPFICIYYKYIKESGEATTAGAVGYAVLIVVGSIAAAALIERFYERPLRRLLTRKTAVGNRQSVSNG